MATVFLSYAHEDSAIADGLSEALREIGIDVWRDRERLLIGQGWPKALGEAITAADALVLLWSSRSAGSPFVELEWTTAVALKVQIFPIQFDGTPLPSILSALHVFSGADMGAATSDIKRGLANLVSRGTAARSETVIQGLNSIASSEPKEVLRAARAVFRQHNLMVEGSVYQAGGDIHIALGGPPSTTAPTQSWPDKWQVWVGLLVMFLTALILIQQLINKAPTYPTPELDPQLVEAIKPGVVRIESGGEFIGCGLFVRDDGAVLTTAYIGNEMMQRASTPASAEKTVVKLSSGKRLPVSVKRIDNVAEVAVLKADVVHRVTALRLSREPVSQNTEVIGFLQSMNEEWKPVTGQILRVGVDTGDFKGGIEVDVRNSFGSPVFNSRGEVIGMMLGLLKGKPDTSILIPTDVIRQALSIELSPSKPPQAR